MTDERLREFRALREVDRLKLEMMNEKLHLINGFGEKFDNFGKYIDNICAPKKEIKVVHESRGPKDLIAITCDQANE